MKTKTEAFEVAVMAIIALLFVAAMTALGLDVLADKGNCEAKGGRLIVTNYQRVCVKEAT